MKKAIGVLLLMLLLHSGVSFGQIRFGLLGGLNITKMTVEDLRGADQKMNYSFHAGATAEFTLSDLISLEPGLMISGKGTRAEGSESVNLSEFGLGMGNVTVNAAASVLPYYIEIPVNAVVKIKLGPVKLNLFAGPYMGIGIAGKAKAEVAVSGLPAGINLDAILGDLSFSRDIKFGTSDNSDIKRTDFGLNMGAGIEIDNFLIRTQYGLGLSNLDPKGSSLNEMRNRVVGISVGYLFGSN